MLTLNRTQIAALESLLNAGFEMFHFSDVENAGCTMCEFRTVIYGRLVDIQYHPIPGAEELRVVIFKSLDEDDIVLLNESVGRYTFNWIGKHSRTAIVAEVESILNHRFAKEYVRMMDNKS